MERRKRRRGQMVIMAGFSIDETVIVTSSSASYTGSISRLVEVRKQNIVTSIPQYTLVGQKVEQFLWLSRL
jgi:hypothetical protein